MGSCAHNDTFTSFIGENGKAIRQGEYILKTKKL